MNKPIIEFVIPTYKRHHNLLVLINSIIVQTYGNWKIHIVSDGKDDEKEKMISYYLEKYIDKIKYSTISGPNKDWGHTAREYGLI
jgi:glycosyltransferase involved in cell wall biosynthesis